MKKALIQLHIAIFLAGFTAILGQLILLNEGILVLYRMLLTAAILGSIMWYNGTITTLSKANFIKIASVGGIVAFHWVMFYGSVKYGNVSIAVVCISGAGFFSALFEPILLKKPFSVVEILLGLLSILGIIIIFDFHPQYKIGIILGIFSAIGSALFPIYNKQLLLQFEPNTITFYEMLGGVIGLLILLPIYLQISPASYFLPTISDSKWLVLLALVCTVYCFYLQLNALKKISAFTANLSYNLEPVYGILLAFILFKENKMLNMYFYVGLLLILLSVLIQMYRVWKSNSVAKKAVL
jgi:drug/metabolite transporter (DMT)-like permease